MASTRETFSRAYAEFSKLPAVNNDSMGQTSVEDLTEAALFEVLLYNSGDSGLTPSQLRPIKAFVHKYGTPKQKMSTR